MKSLMLALVTFVGLSIGNYTFAESDRDHSGNDHSQEETKSKKKENKSSRHEDHEGHDDHEHAEEEPHGHSSHGDHGGSKFGKGKAIVEVQGEGKRFQLAKGAIKTMGLKSIKLDSSSQGVYEVPASSVVDFQNEIGIYKRQGDWFELIDVKVVQRGKYAAKIKASDLSAGDEIVNGGVALLRVAHLEASGQGGQGHVH